MNRIKELRTQKNLTQKEMAAAVGVSPKSVANWETGQHNPNEDFTKKLCEFFKVSEDYLLGKDNAEEQKIAEPTIAKPAKKPKAAKTTGIEKPAKKAADGEKAAAEAKPKKIQKTKAAAKPTTVEKPADAAKPTVDANPAKPQKAEKPAKKQAAIDEEAALNDVLQKFIQDFVRLDGHGKNAMLQLCKAETERCEQQKTLADENTYLCAVRAMRVK